MAKFQSKNNTLYAVIVTGIVSIAVAFINHAGTNSHITDVHSETKAIVSTVSDKSDKHSNNSDTIKMEVRALKKEVDSLLQKK